MFVGWMFVLGFESLFMVIVLLLFVVIFFWMMIVLVFVGMGVFVKMWIDVLGFMFCRGMFLVVDFFDIVRMFLGFVNVVEVIVYLFMVEILVGGCECGEVILIVRMCFVLVESLIVLWLRGVSGVRICLRVFFILIMNWFCWFCRFWIFCFFWG